MKNILKFYLFTLSMFASLQIAFAQDVRKGICGDNNLYPNPQPDGSTKCYPCLGCHPCPSNQEAVFCSNSTPFFKPSDTFGASFLSKYAFSEGKIVQTSSLNLKKGGTVLFQVLATNADGEKVIPGFMTGVKLEIIRAGKSVSPTAIDQNGRVKFVVAANNQDVIGIVGIKGCVVSIPAKSAFSLPAKNVLNDLMLNENLSNLTLEIVAFTPAGSPSVDLSSVQLSGLESVGSLTNSSTRIQNCKTDDNVECACGGGSICGSNKDACCRICQYLKDGTYIESCPNAIIVKPTPLPDNQKSRN